MRAKGQRRSVEGRATKTVIAILVFALAAALLPATGAAAYHHQPTDQPGTAWQGRIETSWNYTGHHYTDLTEHAVYTDLRALGGTASGDYAAAASAEGKRLNHGYCYYTGDPYTTTTEFSGSLPAPDSRTVRLWTNDHGRTFFTPWGAGWFPGTMTTSCTESGTTEVRDADYLIGHGFGLGWAGAQFSTSPLPDDDPDPRHLVGTRTWTIGDWPHEPYDDDIHYDSYTYTVTYDLWLGWQDPPECDVTKKKTKEWKAKTAVPWAPDRHWGNFKVSAEWCYDEESGYGELTDLRSKGTIDDGPFGSFAYAAGLFGFENKWLDPECDPVCGAGLQEKHVSLATVERKMTFCFDIVTLLDKLKVKSWFEKKVTTRLKTKLADFLARHGSFSGPEFDAELLGFIDDYIAKAVAKIDRIDDMLRDKRVPGFIAEWLEDQVEDPFAELMQTWKEAVEQGLASGDYTEMTAEAAADAILQPIFDKVFGLGQICDPVDFSIDGYDHPGLFTLWQPQVTVNIYGNGRKIDFTRTDVYLHPKIEIEAVKK